MFRNLSSASVGLKCVCALNCGTKSSMYHCHPSFNSGATYMIGWTSNIRTKQIMLSPFLRAVWAVVVITKHLQPLQIGGAVPQQTNICSVRFAYRMGDVEWLKCNRAKWHWRTILCYFNQRRRFQNSANLAMPFAGIWIQWTSWQNQPENNVM